MKKVITYASVVLSFLLVVLLLWPASSFASPRPVLDRLLGEWCRQDGSKYATSHGDGDNGPYVRTPVKRDHLQTPKDIPIFFNYGPRLFELPQKAALETIYGDEWEKSPSWQIYQLIRTDKDILEFLKELIPLEGLPIKIMVVYDDPELVVAGDLLNVPRFRNKHRVLANGSTRELTKKLGVDFDAVVRANPYRFNVMSKCMKIYPPRVPRPDDRKAAPSIVVIGDSDFHYLVEKEAFKAVLVHELAHTQDFRKLSRYQPFGVNPGHDFLEITNENSAIKEGWAEYCALPFDKKAQRILKPVPFAMLSKDRPGGGSSKVPFASFKARIATEGVVAAFFAHLENGSKEKRKQIFQAFFDSGSRNEKASLVDFLRSYLHRQPDELERVLLTLDVTTAFSASNKEIEDVVGQVGIARDRLNQYLQKREAVGKAWFEKTKEIRLRAMFIDELVEIAQFDVMSKCTISEETFSERAEKKTLRPLQLIEQYANELREGIKKEFEAGRFEQKATVALNEEALKADIRKVILDLLFKGVDWSADVEEIMTKEFADEGEQPAPPQTPSFDNIEIFGN